MNHRCMYNRLQRAVGLVLMSGIIVMGSAITALAQVAVDPALKPYEKVSGVSGNLNSIGSDTLNNLMTLWAEGFRAIYPNVNIQIEGKGSSTAPPALIEGTAQLGPMSREMKAAEIDAFEKKYGHKPTEVKVAIENKRGGRPINTWGELGLKGEWANRPLSLYGRNSASGTYGFFKEHALKNGEYRSSVKEQPGSSSVVQGVANDLGGIGYSGIGYKTSGVKALALAEAAGGTVQEPSLENCLSGAYPMARFLYIYVNKKPNEPMDKLVHEFVKFVNSKEGQEIVVKDGYYPMPAAVATDTLAVLK